MNQAFRPPSVARARHLGATSHRLRQELAVGRLDAPFAIGALFDPGLWVALQGRAVPQAFGLGHQEAELDVLVVVLAFVDVAALEVRPSAPSVVPHRDVFLPAVAAEVHVVEVAGSIAGDELLALQGDGTLAGRFERGVDLAAAGDELVQLERKERLAGSRP